MQIFQVGSIIVTIQQTLEEGLEPDPALVELLCQEGPKAIEEWTDAIANVEAEAEVIGKRIAELRERKAAREQTVERMKGALLDLLNRHFDGKVKTPLVTVWSQKTTIYDIQADPQKHATFYKFPEPELQKKKAIDAYKAGVLPTDILVTEGVTESVRIRRS